MRRIVVFDRVSADGFFSSLDGRLDWVVPDEELDRAGAEAMPNADTILFGRRTYDMFESFWPHATDDADPVRRAMARWINDATKLVFSRSRKDVSWQNSRLLHALDPRAIEALKKERGKDMMLFGSGSIVSQLTQHGLIDEYQLVVNPILLGSGRTLLAGVSKTTRLELAQARPSSAGNVLLRYVRRD